MILTILSGALGLLVASGVAPRPPGSEVTLELSCSSHAVPRGEGRAEASAHTTPDPGSGSDAPSNRRLLPERFLVVRTLAESPQEPSLVVVENWTRELE